MIWFDPLYKEMNAEEAMRNKNEILKKLITRCYSDLKSVFYDNQFLVKNSWLYSSLWYSLKIRGENLMNEIYM